MTHGKSMFLFCHCVDRDADSRGANAVISHSCLKLLCGKKTPLTVVFNTEQEFRSICLCILKHQVHFNFRKSFLKTLIKPIYL